MVCESFFGGGELCIVVMDGNDDDYEDSRSVVVQGQSSRFIFIIS